MDLHALVRTSKGDHWSRPRLCYIIRHPDHGLGMTVSVEGIPAEAADCLCHKQEILVETMFRFRLPAGQKGRYTVSTMAGGPAEEAGVKTGDRLIWINGIMASTLPHAVLSRLVIPASRVLS